MKFSTIFPTQVARGSLPGAARLNARLLKEIRTLEREDKLGVRWSTENYRGGYTSYGTLVDLHHRFRALQDLEALLTRQLPAFAEVQRWQTRGLEWKMTACWANVMNQGTYHTSHLHPYSTVSGVYYVRVPRGSAALRIEDPRMASYMNAPVRDIYHSVSPKEGEFVLFESWVRHEVPPNSSHSARISISFNYSLESPESAL